VKKWTQLKVAFFTVILFATITTTELLKSAMANPIYYKWGAPPLVKIQSPTNGAHVKSVLLNVTVTKSEGWISGQNLVSVDFYIDGKLYQTIKPPANLWVPLRQSWEQTMMPYNSLEIPFKRSQDITDLADGYHTAKVSVEYTGMYNSISGTFFSSPEDTVVKIVHFTLDSSPPNVSFLSVEKSYETCKFPLNFTVNESVSEISYVLDDIKNVTIAGNRTLTNLSYGEHNITVYATDKAGNKGASETLYFTVEETEPSPVPLILASIGAISVIGIVLLVYFKKRKH